MKKYIFFLFAIFNANFAYSATNKAEDIYLLAQTGNTTELQTVKNIDTINANGDTALCSAVKDGNIDAYNLLKSVGADTEHKCVKKIPTEQYEHFITKVASANNSWSFLGLGKWAWTGIGAGVAVGAVAAGMGGGGSGGGSGGSSGGSSGTSDNTANINNNIPNCGAYAYYDGTQCVCNWGAENYIPGVGCSMIDCGAYAYYDGTQCVCAAFAENYIPGVGCSPIECGVNAYFDGTQCVCNNGYENWTPGVGCSPIECGVNATQQGTQCQCDEGYTNWTLGYGCYETRDCGVNATQIYNICVCNDGYDGWTSAYGCYEALDCGVNAHQAGTQCVCNSGYQNWTEGVGCSQIECGAHAYFNGTQCVCESGYQNWTEGIGCAIYGIFSPNNMVVNNDVITINNTSETRIYGIGGFGKAYNAVAEYRDLQDHTISGDITITNNGNQNVYGIYSSFAYNALSKAWLAINPASHGLASTTGNINITNTGNGNIYGIYGDSGGNVSSFAYVTTSDPSSSWYSNASASGVITINNTGDGDVWGIFTTGDSGNVSAGIGSNSHLSSTASGYIFIENTGNGNVTGIQGDNVYNVVNRMCDGSGCTRSTAEGAITISNHGNGNVYGIKSKTSAKNVAALNNSNYVYNDSPYTSGQINITNDGLGNTYGMYTDWIDGNLTNNGNPNNGYGHIKIYNKNNGNAYGMYRTYNFAFTDISNGAINNFSAITLENISNGEAIGMYADGGTLTNSGAININNIGTGTVIGILGAANSNITNTGTINITRNTFTLDGTTYTPTSDIAGNVFGIYAKSGSTVNNSGNINITTNGNAYGIYAESGATVTNTGTITLNGISRNGSSCDGSVSYGNYIYLNGSTLYNSGVMQAQSLNLGSMGGNVVAGLGSQFVVDNELSGDLNISSDIVAQGNQTTYIAQNMIDAGDVSGLNVRSASAMFDASLADNGHDVVMQMKDFNELTDNKSLAAFLKNNYDNGNGAELFSTLKSMDNIAAFNGTLSGLTGLNTFTQFAHEDLSAMREISFSMNNKLFENSSRDSFDISDSTGYFSFSNDHNGGSGRYGISSDKIGDNWKLGYGMAMANINTGDGNDMHRQNNLWLFYMPATYANDNIELVVAPKAGFAHSEYNRRGYNNINYDGYIEKRIFGLMNDLRYPLTFGNWTFAPDLAFNAIVYDQSGHEDEQEFSLIIPDDRTVSVESGLGLYTKYEKTLQDGSRFKLNSGLMVYREFGDTYDIKLGMRGMDGTFSLYNNDYEYRGAASLGFDYMAGYLHLYGNAQYFMDNDDYMNFKGGVSYRF